MTKKQSQSVRARRADHLAQQKRRKNFIIAAGVVSVIVIVGLLFWTRQITGQLAAQGIVSPTKLAEPAAADGKAWGPADAPVVIEEYSDFQCPFCGRFAQETGEQILATYGETGQVRFEYNHYPFLGPESVRAAEAAECANEQGAFWQYHNALFLNQKGENQGNFSDRTLQLLAANLGLNEAEFRDCLSSGRYGEIVQAELEAGRARGVNSTPTFYINGEEVRGALPFAEFQTIIEAALAGS